MTRTIGIPGTGISDRRTINTPAAGDPKLILVFVIGAPVAIAIAYFVSVWIADGHAPAWITTLVNVFSGGPRH